MEVRVGAIDLYRFVPEHRLQAEFRAPMEFDKGRLSARVDQPKSMHPESFHETERARNRAVGHDPHRHVDAFRGQRNEVPEIIMRGLRLRKATIRFRFRGMNEIRKLDRILDEKHRDVISDDVPVALLV